VTSTPTPHASAMIRRALSTVIMVDGRRSPEAVFLAALLRLVLRAEEAEDNSARLDADLALLEFMFPNPHPTMITSESSALVACDEAAYRDAIATVAVAPVEIDDARALQHELRLLPLDEAAGEGAYAVPLETALADVRTARRSRNAAQVKTQRDRAWATAARGKWRIAGGGE
jgi:hypothetical protein